MDAWTSIIASEEESMSHVRFGFSLLVLVLFALGCNFSASQPPTPDTALEIPALPTATEQPTATPEPLPLLCADLTFDAAILGVSAVVELVPAMPGGDFPGMPQYQRTTLIDYPVQDSIMTPILDVYPLAEYFIVRPDMAPSAAAFEELLRQRPPAPAGEIRIPWIFGAARMMDTKNAYLDFANGSGVRYLTQYGQAFWEINNRDIFYSFQGLTTGGECWVSVVLPIHHPRLPAGGEVPAGDPLAYYAGIEASLEAEPGDTFLPGLELLDALIASIIVH